MQHNTYNNLTTQAWEKYGKYIEAFFFNYVYAHLFYTIKVTSKSQSYLNF